MIFSRSQPVTYFQLWNAGLFNQLLSLEVACGLHAVLERPTVLGLAFDRGGLFSRPLSQLIKDRPWLISNPECTVLDLVEGIPPSIQLIPEALPRLGLLGSHTVRLDRTVIEISNDAPDPYRREFFDGRGHISLSELKTIQDPITIIKTIAWYSRVFLGRTPSLLRALQSLKFRPEILALAAKIAADLSPFSAAHLRCTDFPSKIFELSKSTVLLELNDLAELGMTLVISCDEWEHPIPTTVLRTLGRKVLALEEHILSTYQNEFRKLPIANHVTLAAVSNLVLGHAVRFKATPGSTFSGYIHRAIACRGQRSWEFFGEQSEEIPDHRPSWSCSNVPSRARNWWREWPEACLTS